MFDYRTSEDFMKAAIKYWRTVLLMLLCHIVGHDMIRIAESGYVKKGNFIRLDDLCECKRCGLHKEVSYFEESL